MFRCDNCLHSKMCRYKDNLINIINMFDNHNLPPGVRLDGMCTDFVDSKNPQIKARERAIKEDQVFRDNLARRYGRDVYELED